jgi:hypothetical protein
LVSILHPAQHPLGRQGRWAQEIGGRAGFRWFGLTTRISESFPLSHWPSLPRKDKEGWPGRIAPGRVGWDGGVDEAPLAFDDVPYGVDGGLEAHSRWFQSLEQPKEAAWKPTYDRTHVSSLSS